MTSNQCPSTPTASRSESMQQWRALGLQADAARYEPKSGKLVIELHSGARFEVPTALIQGLDQGSADQLKVIQISPSGLGLHFPELDADILISGLLNGVMGTPAWMAGHAERIERVKAEIAARPPAKSLAQRPVAGNFRLPDKNSRIVSGLQRVRGGAWKKVQVAIADDGELKEYKLVAKGGVRVTGRKPK